LSRRAASTLEHAMSIAPVPAMPHATDALLEKLATQYKDTCGGLLSLLEQLQHADPHNHLPESVARKAAVAMGVPLAQVFSVVTFYSFFNLKPQGKHTVTICRGTACHTRGSRNLLESVKSSMQFAKDPDASADRLCLTTVDNQVTLRTVACFGQCALAPVVEIDHTIHGHVNRQKLLTSVGRLVEEGARR
jgi:NADH-quinone oxidoreductase subunit E